jgi:hypothetical protein
MAYIQTIGESYIPKGFFDSDNVDFIQKKITQMINKDITTKVTIPKESIARVMQRVLEQRLESIAKMNERVVMYAVNDYLNYQVEANRNLNRADDYIQSQRLFDPTVRRGVVSNWSIKTQPKQVPSTVRFYFT